MSISRAKLLSEAIKISWRSSDREKDYYEAIARRYPSVTGKFIKERLNAKTKYTIVVFEKFAFAYLKKGHKKIDKNASIEYAGFGNFKGRTFKYDPKKKTFTSLGGVLEQVDPSFNSIKDILGRPDKKEVKLTPCEEWFGKFLFGDKSDKIWLEGDEQNTEVENKVLDVLKEYMNSNDKDNLHVLEKLYQCRHLFSKWLTPKTKVLYRGLAIDHYDVHGKFENENMVRLGNIPDSFFTDTLIYTPLHIVESWTTDITVAAIYSMQDVDNYTQKYTIDSYEDILYKRLDNMLPTELPVILKTTVDDSFFGTAEFSNLLMSQLPVPVEGESEVFRFSKKGIKCEAFTPIDIYDEFKIQQRIHFRNLR